jgi:phenylacetate-CoA ligase
MTEPKKDITSHDYMSKQEIFDLQDRKFTEVISYITHVPFYRKKLQKEGINIKDIHGLLDLTKLPFTTKEELRVTGPMERTSHNFDGIAFFFSSSGTTGSSTVYPWSIKDDLVLKEVAARCMKRVGVGPGDISLVLAPFGMPIMWYCMINQYLAADAGVVPLGIASPDSIVKTMSTFPITTITTVPVVGTRLFEFMKRNKIPLVKNRLRHFHFGGDYLSNARRHRVENYWGVDCYDFYGLSEIFGPIAGECKEKNGLHLAVDHVFIEVINPYTKEEVREGEIGVAVYTTLWEKAAPILRYWSDDYVSITWERCKCGRTSPRIMYEGRPIDGVTMNKRWIFAKNIEEILLSFSECSDEWGIKIDGTMDKPIAKLYLENSHYRIPVEKIKESLADMLQIPIKIEIVPIGFFSRNDVKPRRIVDMRADSLKNSNNKI